MKENLSKFIDVLTKTQTECGPHEAAFGLLKDLAKQDPDIVRWIEEQFASDGNVFDKSDLARIAIATGLRGKFEQFLRDYDDWEDSDFEDL